MSNEPILDLAQIRLACSDGDSHAIAELSSTLVGNYRHREIAANQGKTHLVSRGEFLADALIRNFAYRMLLACSKVGSPPPTELIDLFQHILGQDRPPSNSDRRYIQRLEAIQYLKENPNAGIREIARAVRVSPSTITRWKQNGKLQF